MTGDIGRRAVLIGGGAAVLAAGLGVAAASAAPQVTCHAVMPNAVAVLVTGLTQSGTAVVYNANWVQVGSGEVVAGRALMRVFLTPGTLSRLHVRAPGFGVTIDADSRPGALAASPWRLVNKKNGLGSAYVPPGLTAVGGAQLRGEAAQAFLGMQAAAARAGHSMTITSGYRSYATQQATYAHWVSVYGQAVADTISARPGFSEHQLGLAVDVQRSDGYCALDECFASTTLGQWVRANCTAHGFILRYEQGRQSIVGYSYEPWHLRYLGVPLASHYRARGAYAYEWFMGLNSAPTY